MPSNIAQSSSPPPLRQSQIGGWTVLRGSQSAPSDDSESTDTNHISAAGKRKAKDSISSSRPAKSPRLSGSSVIARTSPLFYRASSSPDALGELQPTTSRAESSSNGTVSRATAKASTSQTRMGEIHLPGKRNFPPTKSGTGSRSMNPTSVPALRQESSRSQPISTSRPADRRSRSASSSDSLPDPIALVNSYARLSKFKSESLGDNRIVQRSASNASSQKGSNEVSSLSSEKSSIKQKGALPKPRLSGAEADDDDESVIILSDSDDVQRPVTRKPTKGRNSHQTQIKNKSVKAFFHDPDDIIDLTSDTEMPTPSKSQLVNSTQVKPDEEETLHNKRRFSSGCAEHSSGTGLSSGISSQSHAASHNSQKISSSSSAVLKPPVPRSVIPRLTTDTAETDHARVEVARIQTSRSVFTSSNVGPSCSGSSTLILNHANGSSSTSFMPTSPSTNENRNKLVDVGIIDLCSDSDEAMEVDGLLSTNSEPPKRNRLSSVHSVRDNQRNGGPQDDRFSQAPPLPQLSQQHRPDLPLVSSPSLTFNSKANFNNKVSTSATPESMGELVEGVSSREKSTFGEASSLIDATLVPDPSEASTSIICSHDPAIQIPLSSSAAESPKTSDFGSSRFESNDSDLPVSNVSKVHHGELSGQDGMTSSDLNVNILDSSKKNSVDAGPSTVDSTSHRAMKNEVRGSTTSNGSTERSLPFTINDKLEQDPTDILVAPVSGMHLQVHVDDFRGASPDPLNTFLQATQDDDVMDVDTAPQNSANSRVPTSPSPDSTDNSCESSDRPVYYARKATRIPHELDVSESGSRSDVSEKNNAEMEEQKDRLHNLTPSRPVISVKEPDFSKLRAHHPSALDDLSDAIKWPAEKIPTELHDMLNSLPANYHHNPQMKYIFESMMEENTAEDEPTSPRIEIYSGRQGPVCPPWEFYYTNRIFYGKGVPRSDKKLLKGCDCDGPCDPNSETCSCVQRQRDWTGDDKSIKGFLYNKKGKLFHPGYPIFECNDACECSEECMNRVIQNGRQHQISICLTKGKGWGVYADEKIPRGTYLGIYSGEMLLESEAAERGKLYDKYGRTYLFDLDFYYLHSLEADKQKFSPSKSDDVPSGSQGSAPDREDEKSNLYTIDAFHVGNFTRFLNHSCDPNCVITPSYVNEPDVQKPTLTIFTTRDVKKGDELCFSYFGNDDEEDEEDQVDEHGQKKKVVGGPGTHTAKAIHRPCLCNAPNCRGKMF